MPRKSELLKQICEELNGLDKIDDLSVLLELRDQFSFLEDSRRSSYTEHKLEDIVMITLLAVLADANEWYKIEVFARKKLDISIDGKTTTGSACKADRTNLVKALQRVSAYSSAYDLSLAQKYIDEKINEIPVTPEIISLLNVKDTIVTWDALNTQK